jgi:S1-C subfamily serine protease
MRHPPPPLARRVRVVAAAIGATVVWAGLASVGSAQDRLGPVTEPVNGPATAVSLPDMVAGAMPAIVEIRARTTFGLVGGTGIVVDANGLILTSHHIVREARSVRVLLRPGTTRPGSRPVVRVTGRVIDRSPGRDVALIRVPLRGLHAIPLRGEPTPRLAEDVVAIGFALAIPGKPTVSKGIIAGLGRSLPLGNRRFLRHLVQTDAALNPGNSGGPLLDTAGRLVGLNAAVISDGYTQNVGFAVDIRQAVPMIRKATGLRGR